MKEFDYKKIDAFTSGGSLGNPAACIYMKQNNLSAEDMLDIAKQHKGFVSEVVYCISKSAYSFKLYYYSSECEVDFCGHGTIAVIYDLIRANDWLNKVNEICVETNKKGTLIIYNEIAKEDSVYITAPDAEYLPLPVSAGTIAEALEIPYDEISKNDTMDFIDAGLRTLIVPISSYEKTVNLLPSEQRLKEFCLEYDIDIILIFNNETAQKGYIAHTRIFAPKFGYLEDPATGSGNSAFGYYMIKNKLWDGKPIAIEQGGISQIFNTIKLKTRNGKVLFGGSATTRIKGVYLV